MKKIFVMVMAIGLMLASVPTVMAGGGQIQGDIGAGSTNELGCSTQPCFDENADKPGSSVAPDLTTILDGTEIDYLTGIITGHK